MLLYLYVGVYIHLFSHVYRCVYVIYRYIDTCVYIVDARVKVNLKPILKLCFNAVWTG